MVDLETRHVDVDRLRNGSAGQTTSSVWVTMLTAPPRFTPGRLVGVDDVDRNAHADGGALAQAHEIDMNRMVPDRIELEVARDHAVLRAVDLEIVEGGQKAAGEDALLQFGCIERDRDGGLAVAVDYARHAAFATHCPGGPLAACGRAVALSSLTVAMVRSLLS